MLRGTTIILVCSLVVGCGDAAAPAGPTPSSDPAPTPESDPVHRTVVAPQPTAEPADLIIEDREEPTPRCLPDAPTCFPIFLAHGFMANPEFLEFYRVADHLRAQGYIVVEGAVEPFDGVEVRGSMLADQIDAALAEHDVDRVNVIAHSMGGLDARYAISTLGVGDRVATLTTISTPHRGSAAADSIVNAGFDTDSEVVRAVLRALGTQYSEGVADDPRLQEGLRDLTEAAAPEFNARNPDHPNVEYQSWAGLSNLFGWERPDDEVACEAMFWNGVSERDEMDATFAATAPMVAHGAERIPNDGMVTVESAKWGTFRGCITADHGDEVGQIEDDGADLRTGFSHLEFFEFLADDLARRGF